MNCRLTGIFIFTLLLWVAVPCRTAAASEAGILLDDRFTALSKDWFWGLGTWTAHDGVLRGFESGPRRHGPVKMHKLALTDAVAEFEFRLEGRATFAGIIFNGSQERGHLFHFYVTKDQIRLTAHPKKGEAVDLLKEAQAFSPGVWHQVRVQFKGTQLTATVDGKSVTATHACIAEAKQSFGLGGDSGGPEGEKAGALEFRKLQIRSIP